MATLSEHADVITAAIDAAMDEGFEVETTTCCCGDGLKISDPNNDEEEYIL